MNNSFYINPPGTGEEGCIWGDDSSPIGNWSPYVAGANTDGNGQTFVKLGWNPIFEDSSLMKSLPDFGVKIECPDGGCNGLPCQIDPLDGAGLVDSLLGGTGAGGSNFCVVTVEKGKSANIVAFTAGGGSSGGDDEEEEEEAEIKKEEPESTSVAPTTSEEPTTSSTSTTSTTSTTSEEPSTTSSTSTTTSSTPSTTSSVETSTVSTPTSSSTSSRFTPTVKPGIFHENHNETSSETGSGSSTDSDDASETSDDAPATTSDEEGEAGRRSGNTAVVGLVVAFVAAACIL